MRFRDRRDAGRRLSEMLRSFRGEDAVVYALPRGGVVLGSEIAKELDAPLEVIIVRKVGHPQNPEYAVCAVAEDGTTLCNEEEKQRIDPQVLDELIESARMEAKRRRVAYLKDREQIDPRGRIAILVDDGVATGLTLRAAIRELKKKGPKEVVVAVPVAPSDAAQEISREADEFIALEIPRFYLGAVGAYYDEFEQVGDEEVRELLGVDD